MKNRHLPSHRGYLIAIQVYLAVGLLTGCGDLVGAGSGDGELKARFISPADGASEVSVLDPVLVSFNQVLDHGPSGARVVLWDGNRKILGTTRRVDKGRGLALNPSDPLDFGTDYRVEVTVPGTGDGSGESGDFFSWEFQTEGLPPPLLSRDSLWKHVGVLAHDSMAGRGSGSPEELRAAEYLRDRLLAYGLQPPPGGMIQPFEAYGPRLGRALSSRNVLAVIPGQGELQEQWILAGAHYDHIGFRGVDDGALGPNNGADDNASGTALILELGRVFQSYVQADGLAGRPRRSLIVAAFGAEEEGLLGSCFYAREAPAVALGSTSAMMNFDMVGRLRNDALFLSGGETSDVWASMVANANQPDLDLSLSASSCLGCTDHACFWQGGVPFLGFFTGLHPEYHTPDDDPALINLEGMERVGSLALRVLNRLMVRPEPPALTRTYPPGN